MTRSQQREVVIIVWRRRLLRRVSFISSVPIEAFSISECAGWTHRYDYIYLWLNQVEFNYVKLKPYQHWFTVYDHSNGIKSIICRHALRPTFFILIHNFQRKPNTVKSCRFNRSSRREFFLLLGLYYMHQRRTTATQKHVTWQFLNPHPTRTESGCKYIDCFHKLTWYAKFN